MTKDIYDYLMFKGFNKYGVASELQKGSLWIRERDGVRMQIFTATDSPTHNSTFLVEVSINKYLQANEPFQDNLRVSGDFVAGPFTKDQILSTGIIDSLEQSFHRLGQ